MKKGYLVTPPPRRENFQFLKASLSLARPYQDWDQDVKTIAEYKEKFRRVNIEMAVCLSINIVVSLVMLVPLCYTGRCRSIHIVILKMNILQVTRCMRGTVS